MNLTNLTKIALKALNNNKLRCFLTMLGIIIGVASVITMLAIGQGSKRSIREQISEMGSNMIMIHPGNMERGGVRQDASSMQTLKLNDYKSISEQAEYVSACSPSVNSSGQFIYGANNYPSTIYGITEDYLDIRKISLEEGSMFTPQDVITSAKVCLIGKTITDNLFPNGESPIGKVIRFNKIPLKVIGTLTAWVWTKTIWYSHRILRYRNAFSPLPTCKVSTVRHCRKNLPLRQPKKSARFYGKTIK